MVLVRPSRVRRWAASVAAASLLLVAACGDADDGAPRDRSGSGEAAQLRLQVSGEPEETAVYAAVAEAWEQDNPGSSVEVVQVPEKSDHLARLSTAFAAGNPPDIFLVNFREYAQFVARDAIEPAGPLLAERDVDLDDYFEQPVEAFTYDGDLQCMPQNVSSLVVYYNTALFEERGVAAPKPGWSFDDFVATAQSLTDPEAGIRGVGLSSDLIRIAPFVWSAGGEVVDDTENPTRFTLNTPEARAGVEAIVGLARAGLVPTEEELAAQNLQTRFVTGKLGMFLSSRREVPALREVQGLEWDVAGLPVIDEPASILHSDAYCISAGSDNVEAAADLVAFAAGEQGQTIAALGGRTVPSLRSVADSPAFLDPSRAPASSGVFLDAVPLIRRTPVVPSWPEIEDIAEEQLTRAFYEGGDVGKYLDEIARQADPLLQRDAEGTG
jgi:multiple sugar transport system substrate-binding protein